MGKDKSTHHSENGGIHWIRVCVFLCICLVQFARVLTSNLIRCDLFIYYVLWRAMMLTGDCKTVSLCPGPISGSWAGFIYRKFLTDLAGPECDGFVLVKPRM